MQLVLLVIFSWSDFKAVCTCGTTGQVSPRLPGTRAGFAPAEQEQQSRTGPSAPRWKRAKPSPCRRVSLPAPAGTGEGLHRAHTELRRPKSRTDAVSRSRHHRASSTRPLCQEAQAQIFESSNLRAVYCPSMTNKLLNAVHQQASSLCYLKTDKCIITSLLLVPKALPTHQPNLMRERC